MHGRSYATILTIWFGELFVGLAPLLRDSLLHLYLVIPTNLARCRKGVAGEFLDCHWAVDNLDAEICIVAIVLSGLAPLPVIPHSTHQGSGAWRYFVVYLMTPGLGSILVIASMMFVLINAGFGQNPHWVVREIFSGAILGSLLIAVIRK